MTGGSDEYDKGERASREEAREWAQDMLTDALTQTSAHAMHIRTRGAGNLEE